MLEANIDTHSQVGTLGAALEAEGIEVERNVVLAPRTYLRTGGIALLLLHPRTIQELALCINRLHAADQPYKLIGNTSNLLFRDEASYAVLVSTMKLNRITHNADSRTIIAECGVMMPDLSRVALWNEARGFEGLEGIPGTIGGGIFMNAGAYGTELKDNLERALVIRTDGRSEEIDGAELGLTHRASALRRGAFDGIVVRCTFRAEPGDAQRIFHKMEVYHAKRHKYQDFMYPNLGSIYSGSPYRALAAKDRRFKILSALFMLIRYEYKIFHRESPLNRKWLNDLVLERFDLKYDKQPFSDKTLNCLVNRGQGTDEMVRFINQMEEMVGDRIPLENEIVEGF